MPSYCCFNCPSKDYSPRSLDDLCESCGQPYGFPLTNHPASIGPSTIVRPLGRGFYSATYLAKRGNLGKQHVLKVTPVGIYSFFEKDFEAEARLHDEVAQASRHLAAIANFYDQTVEFGSTAIACHVAELDYVDGPTLADFLDDPDNCTAKAIAQIAIDLFELLGELESRQVFHNDLHANNIIVQLLGAQIARAEAVDRNICLVAIDFGSMADASLSEPDGRLGDLARVAEHLLRLVGKLLSDPDNSDDIDYRLATVLEELSLSWSADPAMQRPPDFQQAIADVRDAFQYVNSPWILPPGLRTFDQSINAQTLHPYFVPHLLVDPEGHWIERLSKPGPLLVTGMRGCGKTMLLRALQFHSRASYHRGSHGADGVFPGLEEDGYVGLYVSCTRLLDSLANARKPLHEPLARLFVAYAREGLHAIRHLREAAKESHLEDTVATDWQPSLGQVLADHVRGGEALANAVTELDLEHALQRILVSLDRGENTYGLSVNPSIAFGSLAETLRAAAKVWRSSTVFFLLDDVSTRHLDEPSIRSLISQLLFSSEVCAFKITTETQTLELVLRSPGLVEPARAGRDYEQFDLGAEVNKQLDNAKAGRAFIASVLKQRADRYAGHPDPTPAELLGDSSLEETARVVATAANSSASRKTAYHGLSALTAVCVGDIGDVIHIYELMLRGWDEKTVPIGPQTQSACFIECCNQRLYYLNRRHTRLANFGPLKDFALSFADASRQLLLQSYGNGTYERLRQYSKVYVRLTTGDATRRLDQIRELVDAGVFVLESVADSRSKTLGSEPIQQFVLTFRKLLGLSSYIGLSDRDRFELSGAELEEWLDNPSLGREILVRHLVGRARTTVNHTQPVSGGMAIDSPTAEAPAQHLLFVEPRAEAPVARPSSPARRAPRTQELALRDLADSKCSLVLGLGFEERTLASATRLAKGLRLENATAIAYPEPGRSSEILGVLAARGVPVRELKYDPMDKSLLSGLTGRIVVDITGLAKPAIFWAVRDALRDHGKVIVAHTEAQTYFPSDKDLESVFAAEQSEDPHQRLEALSRVWSGEQGPYSFEALLRSEGDDARPRVLVASASPKHERLLSLLEERECDVAEIVVPADGSPRNRLAGLAADVAIQLVNDAALHPLRSNDLAGTIALALSIYQRRYVQEGYDVEIGLTGSKLQAVALAAVSAVRKVSQVWYVRPSHFDPARFTSGVGRTWLFELSCGADAP